MSQAAKILMIEDSVSLTAVYKAYLEDTDYQLVTVETLGSAHASLGAFQPDIVLLDIELPDGSGMDFLAEAEAMDNPPKIIIMTAHGTSDMAVEAIRRGAFDFLTKPFDAARLKVIDGFGAGASSTGGRSLRTRPPGAQVKKVAATVIDESGRGWRPGDRVRHNRFGTGVVLACQGTGPRLKLVVFFDRAGRKTLVPTIAKLERL